MSVPRRGNSTLMLLYIFSRVIVRSFCKACENEDLS